MCYRNYSFQSIVSIIITILEITLNATQKSNRSIVASIHIACMLYVVTHHILNEKHILAL